MRPLHRTLVLGLLLIALAGVASAQSLDVTFRYVPRPADDFVRVFLPGEFNSWGPNSSGRIAVGAPSQMTLDAGLDQWLYTTPLQVGRSYQYKVHFHFNDSGSDWKWIPDPLNEATTGPDNNSVFTVTDPLVFQLAQRKNADGAVVEVSAGIFATEEVTELTFEIDGASQDGLPFFDAENGIFRYALPEPAACGVQFKLSAGTASGTVSAEVGVVPPVVQDAPRPAGVQDGVTYVDDDPTRAVLSLFAPDRCFVHAIGDFNGWALDDDFLMRRDATAGEDSVRWWLELDGLTPTREYAYQYLVDGELRTADFYSEKVLDPVNDPFIPASTFPDLKPYPTGQTTGLVSVLQTGRSAYPWVVDDFERPPQHELVIYELLVRDFIEAHDYQTLADTLDYLDRLGVNAIELMPVSEFGGNINWGYQPQFYFAPDKYYGPAAALKRFIDEAHQRGIAVILDVVYNHVDLPNPLIELYGGVTDGNPFINVPARHPFNVFFDLNHENPYTRHWLDRVNRYWLTEFKVDGFRFDLSKGFTQRFNTDVGAWSAYDASRIAILTRMADRIWAVDPEAYVILEHFGEDREERELATYRTDEGLPGMMLWNNLNHAYNEATMGYHDGGKSDVSRVYFGAGGKGWPVANAVSYMESHDEQWLMFKNISFGACERAPSGGSACDPSRPDNAGTYNVRFLPVALDRMKLAGAFFFTIPGPKMTWMFGELGYGYGDRGEQCLKPGSGSNGDCPGFAPGRTAPKPIRWDYRSDPLREKLYKTWAALLGLRTDHEVFRSIETEVDLDVRGPVKVVTLTHPTMSVYLIGNFGVLPTEFIGFDFQVEGLWYEYFTGEVRDSAQDDAVSLRPGEFRLYTTEQLPLPEPGLITVDVEEAPELPQAFHLAPNYPNPFNPVTTIRYTLPDGGPARLEVFDVLGRRVAVLVDGPQPPGTHAAVFEAHGLPGGVYRYRLRAGGRIESRAMVLMK